MTELRPVPYYFRDSKAEWTAPLVHDNPAMAGLQTKFVGGLNQLSEIYTEYTGGDLLFMQVMVIDPLMREMHGIILAICAMRGIPFVSIGGGQLISIGARPYQGWPAIWDVPALLGIDLGCGSPASAQCKDIFHVYADELHGVWDTTTKTRIDTNPINWHHFSSKECDRRLKPGEYPDLNKIRKLK